MWTIEQTGPAPRFVVKDAANGEPIASTYGQDGQEAHALKMAAAPAMLAALQELVADATGAAVVARNQANTAGDYSTAYVTRLTRAIEAGRAAIAAATGAPTDGKPAPAPTGEIWLSCIIRKGWEPRLSYGASLDEIWQDVAEYCRDVLDLDTQGLDTLDELEALLVEQGQSLFWERAR